MNVLIIEDETTASKRLRKMINSIDANANFVGELDSVEASIDFFRNNDEPDLIFLDIHLADGHSFNIFHAVNLHAPIIFTTAYDEFALKAFQVNAIDYLLKPIKRPALEQALKKYRDLQTERFDLNYEKLAKNLITESEDKRFLIRTGARLQIVEMKEVSYFYTEDKLTFLTTEAGKRYAIDYSLDQLYELVPRHVFFRINRQFIVRLGAIAEMYTYSKSRVLLKLSPPCKLETIVSTERSPRFKLWLEGKWRS